MVIGPIAAVTVELSIVTVFVVCLVLVIGVERKVVFCCVIVDDLVVSVALFLVSVVTSLDVVSRVEEGLTCVVGTLVLIDVENIRAGVDKYVADVWGLLNEVALVVFAVV